MNYKIFQNGEQINTIVADEAFVSAYCAESGLMEGVDGGAFNPNGSANRAMGATVLARLAGLDEAA